MGEKGREIVKRERESKAKRERERDDDDDNDNCYKSACCVLEKLCSHHCAFLGSVPALKRDC